MKRFLLPREVYFGEGSLDAINSLSFDSKNAFVVTDKNIVDLGLLNEVTNRLKKKNIKYIIYDGIQPDPSRADVEKGLELLKKESFEPDWIVGVGGGSVIDVAKAIFVFWERPDLDWKDVFHHGHGELPKLRNKSNLMCISTTSGTGSEVSMASVITNPDTDPPMKDVILSPEIQPDIAIADPQLTMNLPPAVTAATGLDAIVHAIEAYTTRGKNDFSDALAIKSLQMIFKYLPIAYKEGVNNKEAREGMATAQMMACAACANAGLGLAHALGQHLGTVYKVPHGLACGVPLPYVIKYNAKSSPDHYAEIANHIGISFSSPEEGADKLVKALVELMLDVGISAAVKDHGVPQDDFENKVDIYAHLCKEDRGLTGANPVEPEIEDIKKLYLDALYGKTL